MAFYTITLQGGSAANTDGPTDDEDSDGRSHYTTHGSGAGAGTGSNITQTYRERRREAHTQVFTIFICGMDHFCTSQT